MLLVATLLLFPLLALAQSETASWPKEVRVVYLPVVGKAETVKRFEPLTRHLGSLLGIPVSAVVPDTYEETIAYLAKGEFELAYLSPLTYVEAEKIAKLEPLVMELDQSGNRVYHSIIIARSDSPYQKFEDLRGRTLAFSSPKSTSGFLVPYVYFLTELKETPAVFADKVVFAGNHAKVIKGVLEGKFDAGATNDVDLNRTLNREGITPDKIRVVWTSKPIPGPPLCVRPDLPQSFKTALLQALLSFNQNRQELEKLKIGGFAAASREDYEMTRKLAELAK